MAGHGVSRRLQAKGLPLATIRRLLDGDLGAADEVLVSGMTSADGADPAADVEAARLS